MAESIIRSIIKKNNKNIIKLDGLLQWALNPTSMSAGYGIEKNYPYIERNLKITYELSAGEAEIVVKELKEECNEFIELQTDKYDIGKYRKYIIGEISNNYFNLFNKYILKRIKKSSKGVNDFLNIYQKSQIRKYECLCTQYNAIYGENLREDELIHSGVLKVLNWISSGNIENSSSDPILVPFLESVVKHLKLKKWRPYKPKVTDFIGSLKENRENSTIKFLIGLMKRDQICDSMLKGHKISSKKGILGFYSNPHSKNIDYGGISFLIKKDLFESIEKYVAEDLREKTKKILKILEYEIQYKKQPSKKDLIRIADLDIEDIEIYEDLLNQLPRESFFDNQDIKNKASETIKQFDDPSLYDLLNTLQYDIETARMVGKYLIDNNMISELSRVPRKISSSSLRHSKESANINEDICNNCKTSLSDKMDSKYCPYCGSSDILRS